MEITPNFKFVEGSFDTLTNKMLVIASDNHGAVIDKLQSVNMSVVWVLRDLQKIKAEFEDITAA